MKVGCRYQMIADAASRTRGDQIVAWLRSYGEKRVNARMIDERRTIPPYVANDLGNQGIFGVQVETQYGGSALRTREVGRILEQAAAIDLALGTWILVCLHPGVRPIATFAQPALKQEVLPQLAAGRVYAGFGQTEPGAGTNFAVAVEHQRGLLRRRGDGARERALARRRQPGEPHDDAAHRIASGPHAGSKRGASSARSAKRRMRSRSSLDRCGYQRGEATTSARHA